MAFDRQLIFFSLLSLPTHIFIPSSAQHIFDKIALADNVQYLVRASYLEIYNEEIRDLLSKVTRVQDTKQRP